MNAKQRELLIYSQGMLDGLIWCVPDDTVEAFSCVLEKLVEIQKLEENHDSLEEAALRIQHHCENHNCITCSLSVNGDCPFVDERDEPLRPYLWSLSQKKEDKE